MTSRLILYCLLAWITAAVTVTAQLPPSAQPAAQELKVPREKWLDGERGYLEAKEIQEATGADILLYFFRYDIKNEKGLCTWWERHGLQNGDVKKYLKDYIKVKMQLPFRKKEIETFSQFQFKSCPAVYVVKPSGYPQKITVFDWPGNEPKIKSGQEIISLIEAASSKKTTETTP